MKKGKPLSKTFDFTFSVLEDDYWKAVALYQFILNCIEKKEKIPSRVAKSLLDLVGKQKDFATLSKQHQTTNIKSRALQVAKEINYDFVYTKAYYEVIPDYIELTEINGELISNAKPTKKRKVMKVWSFEIFLDSLIKKLLTESEKVFLAVIEDRNECIRYSYRHLKIYLHDSPESFSFNRKAVLAGIVSTAFNLTSLPDTALNLRAATARTPADFLSRIAAYQCEKVDQEKPSPRIVLPKIVKKHPLIKKIQESSRKNSK